MLLEEIPRNTIDGSKDKCIYNFGKYCQVAPLPGISNNAYFLKAFANKVYCPAFEILPI